MWLFFGLTFLAVCVFTAANFVIDSLAELPEYAGVQWTLMLVTGLAGLFCLYLHGVSPQ